MNIALLGAGEIFYELADRLTASHHHLKAVATNKNTSLDTGRIDKAVIIYNDYCDIVNDRQDIDLFLMCSYAPLIKKEYYENNLFVNIHYAVLPRFRGFHGMHWALINDEKFMGYTLFRVNHVIDGGPIYCQYKFKVQDTMDLNQIRTHLEEHLANHIITYLDEIEDGKTPVEQNEAEATYVTKRKPEDGIINWEWESRLIFNHIRALAPPATPGAYIMYRGKKIVFSKAVYHHNPEYYSTVGKIVNITNNGGIYVKCRNSFIEITEIIIDGKALSPGNYFKTVGISL